MTQIKNPDARRILRTAERQIDHAKSNLSSVTHGDVYLQEPELLEAWEELNNAWRRINNALSTHPHYIVPARQEER